MEPRGFEDASSSAARNASRAVGYAAAFGLAQRACDEVPVLPEDDRTAWSNAAGRWRVVRVRYPFRPGYGRHPALILVVGAVAERVPLDRIALHFHDTRGTALSNVLAALDIGITTFDSSAGGLGGCPYAPGATGNLATEDLLYMLHGLGVATGIDLDAIIEASAALAPHVGHEPASRYFRAARASTPPAARRSSN